MKECSCILEARIFNRATPLPCWECGRGRSGGKPFRPMTDEEIWEERERNEARRPAQLELFG